MNRRNFVKTSSLATAAAFVPFSPSFGKTMADRQFKLCLNPGNIGVNLNQNELLQTAIKFGYEAIIAMPKQLVEFSEKDLKDFNKERIKNNIAWGSSGLPVEFRQDEATFKKDLAELSKYAKILQTAGAPSMSTWIMPTHDTLSYTSNMKQHATRLGECAKIMGEYGIKLGLEYVGPKTLMARDRFAFIRTMSECQELIANTGQSNVGLQLDSFHWYCADDTVEDLLALKPEQIITVDVNDARADLTQDQQIDQTRELPLASGVIDMKSFINALVKIGYDGPIRTEPFNQELRDMDDNEALKLNLDSMKKVVALID